MEAVLFNKLTDDKPFDWGDFISFPFGGDCDTSPIVLFRAPYLI